MPRVEAEHLIKFIQPDRLAECVELAQLALKGYDFDTIAFRGLSGAMIAAPVAMVMQKHMILVRKPGDTTHSSMRVEGNKDAKKYVILDDFTSSGKTKKAIIEAVDYFAPDACFLGLLEVSWLRRSMIESYHEHDELFPLS